MKNILKPVILLLFFNTLLLADNNITMENSNYKTHIETKVIKHNEKQEIQKKSIPEMNINLIQSTNWYLILMPIVTIVIVIIGFLMTRKQMVEKTKESINSFDKSIEQQTELAKNEIKLETLSKNRQLWINTLRNEISEFIGLLQSIKICLSVKNYSQNEIMNSMTKLLTSHAKIELLINPTEEDSKKLLMLLDKIRTNISQVSQNKDGDKDNHIIDKSSKLIEKIIAISQIILKKEWERVKKLA